MNVRRTSPLHHLSYLRAMSFEELEGYGFHLTPNHFYSPIPDIRELRKKEYLWNEENELVGVNMNIDSQLHFLQNICPLYQKEYNKFPHSTTGVPHQFFFNNNAFDGIDAIVLHCMVRHFKPKTIIEIGGGMSTLVSANACLLNGQSDLTTIEPYPNELLKQGFPGLSTLITSKVEDVDPQLFSSLKDGDILFIDTSHVSKIGGDVNTIYLEILPRLNKGVIVHIHDIFFPGEYPKSWVFDQKWFFTEQYLLQAFLTFNSEFEILFCNSYMGSKYKSELKSCFPNSPWWECGGSFWMRRKA